MASRSTSIMKRKRLSALFERGAYVKFNADGALPDDDESEGKDIIKIWVGPPSPLQREMAIREAQAGRSRAILQARAEEQSSQFLNARAFITGLDQDALVDYVLDLNESDRYARARREVLLEKEWDDFNSLRDAMRQFEEANADPGDEEWQQLMARDKVFGDQVEETYQKLREGDREGLKLQPRVELEKKALERRIDQAGSTVFMRIYEDWMLFYACRDDEDHNVQFFENVPDLKGMPEEVQEALAERLAKFITEATEAKNSPRAVSGSTSSEPSDAPVTSEPSGQKVSTESSSVPGP